MIKLRTAVVTTTNDTIASASRVDSLMPVAGGFAVFSISCASRPNDKVIRMQIFIQH